MIFSENLYFITEKKKHGRPFYDFKKGKILCLKSQ